MIRADVGCARADRSPKPDDRSQFLPAQLTMSLAILAVGLALILWLTRSAQTRDRSHYCEHRSPSGVLWKFDVRAMRAESVDTSPGAAPTPAHFELKRTPSKKPEGRARWKRRPRELVPSESTGRLFPTAGLPLLGAVADEFGDPAEDVKWETIPKAQTVALEAAFRRYNDG